MAKLILTIPGIPEPKQSVRSGVVYGKDGEPITYINKKGKKRILQKKYQKKEVVENENNIRMIVLSQLPSGFQPFTGPLKINKLHYIFPPIKSLKKIELAFLKTGGIIYKSTKPDLTDNLQKGLFDALEGIIFNNDSQVCWMENVKKYYGMRPMIILEIEEINKFNDKDLFS